MGPSAGAKVSGLGLSSSRTFLSGYKIVGNSINKIPTITEQATAISKQIGKNSISIRTPNKILHFDLQGATHKGILTPHIQQSLPNMNPKTGQIFWNKDRRWVQSMTQKDIRTVRKYLKNK